MSESNRNSFRSDLLGDHHSTGQNWALAPVLCVIYLRGPVLQEIESGH